MVEVVAGTVVAGAAVVGGVVDELVDAAGGSVSSAPACSTRSDGGVRLGMRAATPSRTKAVTTITPNQTRRRYATASFTRSPPFRAQDR